MNKAHGLFVFNNEKRRDLVFAHKAENVAGQRVGIGRARIFDRAMRTDISIP